VRISAASEYKVQRNSISRFDNVGTSAAAVLLADGSRLSADLQVPRLNDGAVRNQSRDSRQVE
jgi:hypothetical protein